MISIDLKVLIIGAISIFIMSVLIKGMDMPKGCFDCPCCAEFTDTIAQIREYNCQALNDKPICVISGRRADCPLTEIPTPHGDLIDRDVLLRDHVHKDDMMAYCDDFVYETAIEDMPTIIKAEE